MIEFVPLRIEDRETVSAYLRRDPPEISEHTFTNLFVWHNLRQVSWAECDGTLVFVQESDGGRGLLGPPRGPAGVGELLDRLAEAGVTTFGRVPARTAEQLRQAGLKVEPDRDNADYVYRREDLVRLEGRRYHRQKNLIHKCLSSYRCDYRPITPEMIPEVAELQDRWCEERDCEQNPGLCAEYRAVQKALEHYERFELIGGAVAIAGRLEAFSIGERLNETTAVIHFEKAIRDFTGLYQLINRWLCERALEGFELINREQDLGIPGIRKAKESYHPHHMVDKYVASVGVGRLTAPAGGAACGRCAD